MSRWIRHLLRGSGGIALLTSIVRIPETRLLEVCSLGFQSVPQNLGKTCVLFVSEAVSGSGYKGRVFEVPNTVRVCTSFYRWDDGGERLVKVWQDPRARR